MSRGFSRKNAQKSILPVDGHEAGAARGDGVLMITARFPRNGSICGDFYELELDCLTSRNRRDEKPVGIVRREHWPDSRVPRCRPVTEFNRVPGKEDVVADLSRRSVVDCERNGNQFCG